MAPSDMAATELEGSNDISPAAIPFLKFPSNIRDNVYVQLLYQKKTLNCLQDEPPNRFCLIPDSGNQLLAAGVRLLRSCSQVHEEAVQVLYRRNIIHLRPRDVRQILVFFSRVGPKNLSRISSLVLDFQYQYEIPPPEIEGMLADIWSGRLEENYVVAYMPRPFDEEERISVRGSDDNVKSWEESHRWQEINHRHSRGHLPRQERWFSDVSRVLGHLPNFEALARLEVWFPDSQQFEAGFDCMTNDRQLLRKLLSLTQISELKVHGIENLAALEPTNPSTSISSIIAELNHSRYRRSLDVETGRPSLRAYLNWQLVGADRYRITFEFRGVRACGGEDRFSRLPAEIRAKIYGFALLDWEKGFYGRMALCICPELWSALFGVVESPATIETSFLRPRYHAPITAGVEQNEGDENKTCDGSFVGFASLLMVSSLSHRELLPMLYGQLRFSNWNHAGLICRFLLRPPKVRSMVRFLDGIGAANRRDIRHLRLCLDSARPCHYPASDLCLDDLPNAEIDPTTLTEDNMYTSDLYRLFILLQDIPVLHTLHLGLPTMRPRIDESRSALAPNPENHLRPASQLKIQVRCLRMMACSVDLDDAESMARVFGAETVELGGFDIEAEGARSRLETEGWDSKDWNLHEGLIRKRLRENKESTTVKDKIAQRKA